MERVVFGKDSFCQMVEHSAIFQAWFSQAMLNLERNKELKTKMKNLNAAKHRFASTQTPLGRCVLGIEAVLTTAERIANTRTDKFGVACLSFLRWLDDEKLLLLGAMSDAGDEVILLARFFDCETFDTASIEAEIQQFLPRLGVLFDGGACFNTGYCGYMVSFLSKVSVVHARGEFFTLGGPGTTEIQT